MIWLLGLTKVRYREILAKVNRSGKDGSFC
jgi:hypothetical protein